jgi:lysozyme
MKIGPNGLAVVKAFEGCHKAVKGKPGYFKAYLDPVNVLTIGWGHTNHHKPKFNADAVWSQAACDAVLAGDMVIFEKHVAKHAGVLLKQHEYDALVSWAFNTGGPAHATLWKKLNAGDKAAIPSELAKWNKAGGNVLNGLVRRRKAEGQLFAGDIKGAMKTAQATPTKAATIAAGTAVATGTVAAAASGDWSVALFVIAAAAITAAIAYLIISRRK